MLLKWRMHHLVFEPMVCRRYSRLHNLVAIYACVAYNIYGLSGFIKYSGLHYLLCSHKQYSTTVPHYYLCVTLCVMSLLSGLYYYTVAITHATPQWFLAQNFGSRKHWWIYYYYRTWIWWIHQCFSTNQFN